MKNLSKIGGKIVMSLCEIALGIILFINPLGFTATIIKAAGILLMLAGVVSVIRYFRIDPTEAHLEQGLAKALCELAVGAFCVFNTEWFLVTFPIVTLLYGVVILFTGVVRIQWAVDMLRMKTGRWYLAGIGALLSLVFGTIIVLNPFTWTGFLWTFVAISMIVNAIFDLCAALFVGNAEKEKTETK